MSSRIRSTFASSQAVRPTNQENIPQVPGKGILNATKPARRPVLGEATNTLLQQQLAVNAAAKRNVKIEKPVNPLAQRPTVTARNPIRPSKLTVVRQPQPLSTVPSRSVSKVSSLPVPVPTGPRSSTLSRKPSSVKAVENLPFGKLNIKENEEEDEPLPEFNQVEDIDVNDGNSPFLVSPYVNEIYDYLRSLEKKYPIEKKYLEGALISSVMRSTLVSWLIEVQVTYKLTPETLHQTIFIIDRYLQTAKDIPKKQLQLIGVAAMFIASKYEETYCPDLEAFVYISDNAFTTREVLKMEQKMIKCLSFAIYRPLSIHFLRRYSKAAAATPLIHTYGKYFVELALLDYNLCHISPSLTAAAAAYIAISVTNNKSLADPSTWSPTLHYYSKYSYKTVKPIVDLLACTIQSVADSKKMQIVKRKYSQENLMQVSVSPAIQPARIKELLEKQ